MKIITHNDIVKLNLSPATCYKWAEEMIREKDHAILPAKISIKPMEGVFCNVMPSIVRYGSGEAFGGVKVVTRYPERVPTLDSKILLQDANSGEFLALMDANWITSMRTGAVAAHSVLLFAKAGFSEIGMIGLGNTARATLLTLVTVRPDLKLHIKLLRYKGQELLFAERFAEYPNLSFSFYDRVEEVVRGSHVVISAATYFADDLCGDDCFEKGVLIVPIHTRGFTNCDLFFDKIFADDRGHVCHFGNFEKFASFAEVTDVVNGRAEGRSAESERILVYNIGVAMHDINFAARIYGLLKEDGLPDIDLGEPREKMYI